MTDPIEEFLAGMNSGPVYIIEKFEDDEWKPIVDGVTKKPIEFGQWKVAVGTARYRVKETSVAHRVREVTE